MLVFFGLSQQQALQFFQRSAEMGAGSAGGDVKHTRDLLVAIAFHLVEIKNHPLHLRKLVKEGEDIVHLQMDGGAIKSGRLRGLFAQVYMEPVPPVGTPMIKGCIDEDAAKPSLERPGVVVSVDMVKDLKKSIIEYLEGILPSGGVADTDGHGKGIVEPVQGFLALEAALAASVYEDCFRRHVGWLA
jgi:hypothetical protein